MFTGASHTVLYVTVARSQVTELRKAVTDIDPDVFLVVGHGHAAYGRGFRRLKGQTED
jgi:uncharacterized membrane-anchored protein YitT (DUF2179 family)